MRADGPSTATELHSGSDTSKVELGFRNRLELKTMNLLHLFGLKMDSKSTPKATANI